MDELGQIIIYKDKTGRKIPTVITFEITDTN